MRRPSGVSGLSRMVAEDWDFATCKLCYAREGHPQYRLRDTVVRRCRSCGAHYIEYLDPPAAYDHTFDATPLTKEDRLYYENSQHHNRERLQAHVSLVEQYGGPLKELRVLDIGSGGGWFLAALRERGAVVQGIEVHGRAIRYSRETFGLDIVTSAVEDVQSRFKGSFDVVTLWDVVEHVNRPRETIEGASSLLKHGGHLMVGTPCRDALYHRLGALSYKLSRGRFPTLLNVMYSSQPYSHKQILSIADLEQLFELAGVDLLRTDVIMELSLPYEDYLRKILRSPRLAHGLAPLVGQALALFRIRNKMICVGRRRD